MAKRPPKTARAPPISRDRKAAPSPLTKGGLPSASLKTVKMSGLAAWIESNIRLPDTVAEPGPVHLWPWQVGIADAISDPDIEKVSMMKATRLGFSSLLTAAIGYFAVEQPSSILYLLPTEADCRTFIVSDVEPMFDASPILHDCIAPPAIGDRRQSRSTMLHRIWPGGSLKCVAGKAPRNLRAHTAKILMIDEVDAIETSAEGDPCALAERRTMTYSDRKIIIGGTPIDEATSHVLRSYLESDQRIFEVPCPACGAFTEIRWQHIEWQPDQPHTAAFRCPECKSLIDESHKPAMVKAGQWHITHPEIKGHAGFRLNSLVSLLGNCAWGKLATEFLLVKNDSDRLKVFTNTLLGEAWSDLADEVNDYDLISRVEPFGIDAIPPEVLAITAGVDCQDDRLEVSLVGHAKDGTVFILAHQVIWGSPDDNSTFSELDDLLKMRWPHQHGGTLKIDASVIDAGDGGHYDRVLGFTNPRSARRILAGKGVFGFARPAIAMSRTKRGRLFVVGVDGLKTQIINRLARGSTIRFSNSLDATYFEQLASEKRIIRMARGRPSARFERKVGAKAEALDCLVYALSAKAALNLNFDLRESEMATICANTPVLPPSDVIRSVWMAR
jgi:phage terminase large subunit GpA-like protein